jgi:Insect pheromone-binding family, A10/OS-D
MKYTIVILLFAFSAVAYAQKKSGIDNIDVDQVLKNDRILTNYIKCLLDKGPCTSEGRDLKSEFLRV